jgi:CDP-paratose 2-epimerase
VFGYRGKQVRDNIHSRDLVEAFWSVFQRPVSGEVFNIGGSRHSNCSLLEAIRIAEELTGREMRIRYDEQNRTGDHIWWISDVRKFRTFYPDWHYRHDIRVIMEDIHAGLLARLIPAGTSHASA